MEVGTFTGYSALCMAGALPSDGRVVTCEVDPTIAQIAARYFEESTRRHPGLAKIQLEVGPGMTTLDALKAEGASFDFIFVDADKKGYMEYYDAIIESSLLAKANNKH